MAMNGAGGAGADEESILSLLEHFKDDGKVGLLVKELQELSTRVQTAELATIVNPRRGELSAADSPVPSFSEWTTALCSLAKGFLWLDLLGIGLHTRTPRGASHLLRPCASSDPGTAVEGPCSAKAFELSCASSQLVTHTLADIAGTQRKHGRSSDGSAPPSPARGPGAPSVGRASGGGAAEPPNAERGASGSAGGEKLRGIDAFANAVRRVRHQLPSGSITGMGSAAGGSRDASVSGAEAGTAAGGAAANNDNNNSGVSGAAGVRGGRVEEAILPVPPEGERGRGRV